MPVPFRKSHVMATSSTVAPAPPTVNSANHPSGVSGVSTMFEIFSVIDLNVCPGARTLYSPVSGSVPAMREGSFGFFGFRSVVAIAP